MASDVEVDPRPIEENVESRESAVGMGVFAVRDLEEGEIIGQVTGEFIPDPNYSTDYCIGLDEVGSLEPEAPFRYLNHSCNPNAMLVEYEFEESSPESGDGPELYVEALRAIEPGEEILIDYGWPSEHAIPCLCGEVACRGWIVTESELHLLPPVSAVSSDDAE